MILWRRYTAKNLENRSMETLHDVLLHWQPFFAAIAGVAANFAGLLFVALSLNRDNITLQKNRLLLRAARRCFADLIFILIIALIFLMPVYGGYYVDMPLVIVAAIRTFFLGFTLYRYCRHESRQSTPLQAIREHTLQSASLVCLIAACIEVYRDPNRAMQWIVPVIFFLLWNTSSNAWALLLMEKNAGKPANAP